MSRVAKQPGAAFWRRAGSGPVNRTFFIYGDKGPADKLGEGSVKMAEELRIASNPNTGGLDASEVVDLRKGVIHIAFPGSGAAFLAPGPRYPDDARCGTSGDTGRGTLRSLQKPNRLIDCGRFHDFFACRRISHTSLPTRAGTGGGSC